VQIASAAIISERIDITLVPNDSLDRSLFITRSRATLPPRMTLPISASRGTMLRNENKQTFRRSIMKTILSALVALSFVAGAVAPAAAYSGSLIERLDKEGRGGHGQG
jgi:hypothetical protein